MIPLLPRKSALTPRPNRLALLAPAAALAAVLAHVPQAHGQDVPGVGLYKQHCARCHGATGEGAKAFPQPLVGNRSLPQLAKYIVRAMPEDDPGVLSPADAEKIAAYIFDAFYSPAAQARLKPRRLEFQRLTVTEYRNAVADLIGTFSAGKGGGKGSAEGEGLRGEYFTSGGKRNRTLAFSRIDPYVRVDLGESGPDADKLKTVEISANWQGSVHTLDTGLYDFVVHTEHSVRLWVNDLKKPLIDAWIKSGPETEFRGSLYLLGGRTYPVRLEFSRGNVGVRKEVKGKVPPVKTTVTLAWKPPHRADEVIPPRHLTPAVAPTAYVPAVALPPDDRSAGYERGTAVSKAWVLATIDGAIDAAAYVSANLPELTGVRNDSPKRKELLRDYCHRFAERAFRRPLTADQKKLYVDRQFDAAPDPETAVKRVVLLVLQSPRFLYREPPAGSADAHDVAARLSFGLWDSLPDRRLLEAAAGGKLKDRAGVAREAERMLEDPRARARLRGFLLQWLKVDQVTELPQNAKHFPGFDAAAVADLRTSLERFLEDVLWSPTPDYRHFLSADYLYLNGRLSALYGGSLPADAPMQKVAGKPGERAGVLTHPYLLAAHSYTETSSPIHRGVFLARNLLGVPLRQPPDAFTPLPPEAHPKLSTRERIALQTSPKDCRSCHNVINPLGFTLEGFDAIGRPRDRDNGKPIDATGSFVTRSGDRVNFKGMQDLAKFLAGSEEAHEAFVARLFHYLVRQPVLAYGPDRLTELTRFFAANDYNVRRLTVEILAQTALPDSTVVTAPAKTPAP